MNEPRSHLIWRHAHNYVNSYGISWPTYCSAVEQYYSATVSEHLRRVEFSSHRDPHERMRLDAQTVRRLEHDTKHGLPVDLEEAMVMAMPNAQRRSLEVELAARTNLLATPIPEISEHADTAGVASLMRETAEAIEAIAPMLHDGRIDANDLPLAGKAELEILEAMAAMDSMLARVRMIQ